MPALSVKGLPHRHRRRQKLETVTLTCSAVRPKQLTPLTWAPAPRRLLTCAASPLAAAAVSSSSSGIVHNVRPRAALTGTGWGVWIEEQARLQQKYISKGGRETKINK